MTQTLYRKWRPQTWDEVVGQQHVVRTLRNALEAGKGVHAYLFSGPRGTGKTTTARLLAKAANCLHPEPAKRPCTLCEHCQAISQGHFLDLIEIDAASNTSVDDVRELRERVNFAPNQGRYKVYIIDEVHMLSTAAFNALLKTLEEPPAHAIFVLATTEPHKIPATVLSRCQRHEFRRIPVVEIVSQLEKIAQEESFEVEKEALELLARQSTGSMRDAISLLDQLASLGEPITLELTQRVLGTASSEAVVELIEALTTGQTERGLENIHRVLDRGSDPRQFARQIVDYLRDALLILLGDQRQVAVSAEMRQSMQRHARTLGLERLLLAIQAFNRAANEARYAWQPSLPLEVAFAECVIGEVRRFSEADREVEPPARSDKKLVQSAENPTLHSSTPQGSSSSTERAGDRATTQSLAETWQTILNLVRRKNPRAYGVLNSCTSRFIQGDELVLNFASDLLKEKMEKEEYILVVEQVLSQIFQREMHVRCSIDANRRDSLPPGIKEDGMVATALRDLGGEIVDLK